jgi:hypothetical protein
MTFDSCRVVLEVNLKASDLYWAYFANATRTGWLTRGYLALIFVAAIAFVPSYLAPLLLLVYPPFIYFLIGAALYYVLIRPYIIARRFAQSRSIGSKGDLYTITESGIDVLSEFSSSHYQWDAIRAAKQTSSLFVLSINRSAAIVLPKRCFPSQEQLSVFRQILIRQIKQRRSASKVAVPGTN